MARDLAYTQTPGTVWQGTMWPAAAPSSASPSGGPSAQQALLGVLAQAVARAARLRAYAEAQAARRHAPRATLGFVEALQATTRSPLP